MDNAIGQTFGAYRIETLLSSGDSAALYRATAIDQVEPVAVKIIDPRFVESPERRAALLARAARAQDLLHPNLIEILTFGQEHDQCYLVMEFCPHGSAHTLLQRALATGQALPVDLCLDLVRQSADAVAFLAASGIALTRLETHDLMLRASSSAADIGHWSVKLDPVEIPLLPVFGPVLPEEDPSTGTDDLGERTSIRRLGIVLYDLLTGTNPDDRHETEFRPPSGHRPGLAPEVDTILRRCLDAAASDRFHSLDELIEAIDQERSRTETPANGSGITGAESDVLQRLLLDVRHLGRRGARQRIYRVELRNDSTSIAHVTFRARDDHDELRYQFSPEMITVEPGRSRTIVLTVGDKRRRGTPDHIGFLVVATPANGPAAASAGEYERLPTREFNSGKALAGFGALGVIAVVLLALMFGTLTQNAAPAAAPTATAAVVAVANTPTPAPTPTPTSAPTPSPTPTPPPPTPLPTNAPSRQTPLTVRRIDTTSNRVALTFSISNDPAAAGEVSQILRILHDRNVHATFGLRGDWAEQNPDAVKAIVASGDEIINETYDHRSFTGASQKTGPLTSDQRVEELVRADRAVKQVAGYDMSPYYRPPFGDMETSDGTSVAQDAARAGYSVAVLWSIDTKSWAASQSVGQMIADASAAQPGDIILFSITEAGNNKDVSALPQIVDNLQARGRGFATIKELVGR